MEGSELERAAGTGRENKWRLLSWFAAEEKTHPGCETSGLSSGLITIAVTILSAI